LTITGIARGAASLLLAIGIGSCRDAVTRHGTAPAQPINWPVPPGWSRETIPFPLEFAPDLGYRGVEELRFAPDFYSPHAATYWSYDIIWWLQERPAFDSASISGSLTRYFRGLAMAVGKGKYLFDSTSFQAVLAPTNPLDPTTLSGQIHSYDPFTTGQPIVLNVEARFRECPKAGRFAVSFLLSPRPPTDTVWSELRKTSASFTCD
jgi:hypothetical protein